MNSSDEEEYQLTPRPYPAKEVILRIPVDSYEAMQEEATRRDMSLEALLKFYIGAGFRLDVQFVRVPSRRVRSATTDEAHEAAVKREITFRVED